MYIQRFGDKMPTAHHKMASIAVLFAFISVMICALSYANVPAFAADNAASHAATTVDQNQQVAPVDTTISPTIAATTTVRVNRFADPYVVMNLIASTVECVGVAAGALFLWKGLAPQAPASDRDSKRKPLSKRAKILIGIALMLIGLVTPGYLNWIYASALPSGGFS
jgi:hypothetical protein